MPKGIIRIYMGYPWVRPASGSDPRGYIPYLEGSRGSGGVPGPYMTLRASPDPS